MGIPSLSQIQRWKTDHLDLAATHWLNTADGWEDSFDSISQRMASPGGRPWSGDAAAAALSRASKDRVKVQGISDDLRTAATAARGAIAEIEAAKRATLHAVGEAHAEGFAVGEDLTVTDRLISTSPEEWAARQSQAQAQSAVIRENATALAAVDEVAAAKITAAAAGLSGLSLDAGAAPDDSSPIHMVDFRGVPVPEKPSWTSPDMPPGGWSADPVTRAAQKIAYGHASAKHLANEWPPGTTREQLASEVERIMRAGTNPNSGMVVGRTSDGAPAIYDPKTNTLVIKDPGAADAGTTFRPTRGELYIADKVPTRLRSLPPTELADAPARPPVEPPKAEPQAPRVAPRVGLPPIAGVPPLVESPGVGVGDIPVLDADGIPEFGLPGDGG